VPCYNEQRTILTLLKHVAESPWVREIIVVDDGSTDDTRQILADVDNPVVRVVLHARNQGKGAALRTGFQHATSEFVIVQDADLEYDPNEFGDLLPPILDDKADVVFGSRFLSGRPHRVLYFWHAMGNRMLTLASNMFTGLNLSDMETCYKLFRREVLESITIEEDRFGFEPEITAKVAKGGWRIYEVGISYNGRTYADGKKIGGRDAVRAVYCIVRYSRVGDRFRRRS
jgi:glycosyltransferase involved in cell wall biosynthesis